MRHECCTLATCLIEQCKTACSALWSSHCKSCRFCGCGCHQQAVHRNLLCIHPILRLLCIKNTAATRSGARTWVSQRGRRARIERLGCSLPALACCRPPSSSARPQRKDRSQQTGPGRTSAGRRSISVTAQPTACTACDHTM